MDRGEFLSILRESLEGCIPLEDVEENVTFYRKYFDDSPRSDKELIEELGDPRLIARTIIEAYKASKGPMADFYTEQARNEYSQGHSQSYNNDAADWSDTEYKTSGAERIKRKIIGILIALLCIVVLVVVLKVFVLYLLPIILVVLLVKFIADYLGR